MATLPDADIRGYYTALGIELPAWSQDQASVRCFADPDAHSHGDRNPSCSVSLTTGAWKCHGCGAHGGAYDAALTQNHTPRSAIDLMIDHGITERRAQAAAGPGGPRLSRTAQPVAPARPALTERARFTVAERDIERWQQVLARRPGLLTALNRERGWTYQTMRELELGLDQLCQRITIPIRDHAGQLQGLLRYDPSQVRRGPKMLAAPGTRLGLIPHPERVPHGEVLLCEGPADMLTARAARLPAIAIPSATAWRTDWTQQLQRRPVTIIMDSDAPGRHAAHTIAQDLAAAGASVQTVDLAPVRDDGYDLSDWLFEHRHTPITLPLLRELESPPVPYPARRQAAQPAAISANFLHPPLASAPTLALSRRIS